MEERKTDTKLNSLGRIIFLVIGLLTHQTRQLNLDFCHDSLGVEHRSDGSGLPPSAFSASSTYDKASVGPQHARLNFDSSGGAWCPAKPVDKTLAGSEYIQVDLNALHVITRVLTQGRYGNGRGQEYAEAFTIKYWRQGMHDFREYRDTMGRTVLPGNENTFAVANNTLNPVIIASQIRLYPRSDHQRTVCMRIGLRGCPFNEGILSYSIPQGQVRGAMLELMDHTFDGHEDSHSGDLRGGLGQLVDGRYGIDDFKAVGSLGVARGYAWVGWKKRPSATINLMFTFDQVRSFQRVDIHVNNHFTKDIQMFRKAKIYFSNEEDKFGDDRFVDFEQDADLENEDARNVSIPLKQEHGRFIMIQLYFAAKWILVSEVTFISEPYQNPVVIPKNTNEFVPEDVVVTSNQSDDLILLPRDMDEVRRANKKKRNEIAATSSSPDLATEHGQKNINVVISMLLVIILVLLTGITYVTIKTKLRWNRKNSTPTHSLLSRKFTDRFNMTSSTSSGCGGGGQEAILYTSTGKMSVYSNPLSIQYGRHDNEESLQHTTQETIYEEPMLQDNKRRVSANNYSRLFTASSGFLNPNRPYQLARESDEVDEEDEEDVDEGDEQYAEPDQPVYTQIVSTSSLPASPLRKAPPTISAPSRALKPLPLAHLARPMTPTSAIQMQAFCKTMQSPPKQKNMFSSSVQHISSPISASVSPPKYSRIIPPRTVVQQPAPNIIMSNGIHSSRSSNKNKNAFMASPVISPSVSSTVTPADSRFFSDNPPTRSSSNSTAITVPNMYGEQSMRISNFEELDDADVCIPDSIDLARLYEQIDRQSVDLMIRKPTRSVSIDTVSVKLTEVSRDRLEIIEKIGEGQFGELHLCNLVTFDEERNEITEERKVVAVKSLKVDSSQTAKSDFEHEARILTSLNDPNLVRVVGVCFNQDPLSMICEYTEIGDLYQYLQDHVAETSLSKSPETPTLSFGSLIYMASQIASGMKYLESLNFVHRDLATRNCLVGRNKAIKISDFGMSKPCYRQDYFKSQTTGCLLPIRWMAWESVLMGRFTTKSDVWSFGVTLWEILTFCREQPFEHLSDEKVITNLSCLYETGRCVSTLPTPPSSPREITDLMRECWRKEQSGRPSFREIHLFLQRKNLGFDPES